MTEALHGYGASFERGDGGSPESFAAISEVVSITPPAPEEEQIDASHLKSPDAYREFISGLTDPGECTFEMNFIPGGASFPLLRADRDAKVKRNYRIVFPDTPNSIVTFAAKVTTIAPEVPLDDKMSASVTLKVSGKPVWSTAP
jgi:hypothetical protein